MNPIFFFGGAALEKKLSDVEILNGRMKDFKQLRPIRQTTSGFFKVFMAFQIKERLIKTAGLPISK